MARDALDDAGEADAGIREDIDAVARLLDLRGKIVRLLDGRALEVPLGQSLLDVRMEMLRQLRLRDEEGSVF